MDYKIKYLPLAVQDLRDIAQYLSGFYPKTSTRVLREIRGKVEKLSATPNMCEEYEHDPSYRKLVADHLNLKQKHRKKPSAASAVQANRSVK